MWKDGKTHPFKDDETPWCAGAVSAWLERAGIRSARTAWSRAYLNWGRKLKYAAVGAIVVFSRGKSSGHIGIVVGKDQHGNLMVLGGNQGDMVCIKPFSYNRLLGFRWPNDYPLPEVMGLSKLPIVNSNGQLSTNEA